MGIKKSQKQGIGLLISSLGCLILGFTSLTTLLSHHFNWFSISISAILIISGSLYWYLNK